eukprot:Clim_evm33s224 gene=Clim_evmTU33s224
MAMPSTAHATFQGADRSASTDTIPLTDQMEEETDTESDSIIGHDNHEHIMTGSGEATVAGMVTAADAAPPPPRPPRSKLRRISGHSAGSIHNHTAGAGILGAQPHVVTKWSSAELMSQLWNSLAARIGLKQTLGVPDGKRKTLILDLDETLIHSTTRLLNRTMFDFKVEVNTAALACVFFVHKRPHVDMFLDRIQHWFDLVIYTASLQEYADPVIDILDNGRGILRNRYFRESCINIGGIYVKNLEIVDKDLKDVIIIDNSPGAYTNHPENAIPIETWEVNPYDESLLDLIPFLSCLRHMDDVRSVLGLRLHGNDD